MSSLSHFLIVVSYALIAAALGVGLPETMPELGHATAVVIAGMVFVGAALVHEIYSRRIDTDELAEQLYEIRLNHTDALADLRAVQKRMAAFHLEPGGDRGDLVTELKMLKSLVAKLAEQSLQRTSDKASEPVLSGQAAGPMVSRAGAVGPEPAPPALSGAEILGITRSALEHNRVELYLQPVVSLPQRKLRFYETFSRIQSEDGDTIGPEQYIPVAEDSGLVSTIDNLLLFRCVQRLRRRKGDADVGFFCNISSATLHDGEFFAQFIDFMEQNKNLARSLIFEFGQAAVAAHGREIQESMERLADLGFRFSIDQVDSLDLDFADLRRRHFHFVKVDASTLLSEYEKTSAAIDAHDLGEAMKRAGLNLVVEKVEAERTVAELTDFNVDFGQGYLFGEPREARRYLV